MDSQDRAVLLVTGGSDGDIFTGGSYLDSTELLLPSATSWSYSAALPSPRVYLRGATLDNKVIMTGGYTVDLNTATRLHLNEILEFNAEEGTWIKVGPMPINRRSHAVSVINYREIADYCN